MNRNISVELAAWQALTDSERADAMRNGSCKDEKCKHCGPGHVARRLLTALAAAEPEAKDDPTCKVCYGEPEIGSPLPCYGCDGTGMAKR